MKCCLHRAQAQAGAAQAGAAPAGAEEPAAAAETTKTELLEYFKTMLTMRRMEITCDIEYTQRTIRGFCHLYDGQEAVGTGIQAALSPEDSWITSDPVPESTTLCVKF